MEKLKCVIVEDDAISIEQMTNICKEIPYIDVAARFRDSFEFMKQLPTLDFDLCLLNLKIKGINGLNVAAQLNGKPFIFFTEGDRLMKSAKDMAPIDIVSKPLEKEKISGALSKAYQHITIKKIQEQYING